MAEAATPLLPLETENPLLPLEAQLDIPLDLHFLSRKNTNDAAEAFDRVLEEVTSVISTTPEYPARVLLEPAADIYRRATQREPTNLTQNASVFWQLARDTLLTWADLRQPNYFGDELNVLRAAIGSMLQFVTLDLPFPGYAEVARDYKTAVNRGAVLQLLAEPQWRLTLTEARDLAAPGAAFDPLEEYLRLIRESGGSRLCQAGYEPLMSAARITPNEQGDPDLLRTVLMTRLANLEMGALARLASLCTLKSAGCMLVYALTQIRAPDLPGRRPSLCGIATCLADAVRRLRLRRPPGDGCEDRWAADWTISRAGVLLVDSLPGLVPTPRCGHFLAISGAISLRSLAAFQLFLAPCASDRATRADSGHTDEDILEVFMQQLRAKTIRAVVCFVDDQMYEALASGDRFVEQVLTNVAQSGLLTLWCVEGSGAGPLLRRRLEALGGVRIPRDRVFQFHCAKASHSSSVWRSLLRALDGLSYTS